MAAAIAVMHRQGTPAGRSAETIDYVDEKQERIFKLTSKLPDQNERAKTVEMGMLMMDG